MGKRVEEHSFSVEMTAEKAVRKVSFLDSENGHIFFEGYLGKLRNVSLVEGVMLEIEGNNGTLRLDITLQEIAQCLAPKLPVQNGGENR